MKPNIHPEYHEVIAECACGKTVRTGSTLPEIKVSICSACHPFYTGELKLIDTAGRIEKFSKRYTKKQN